MLGEPSLCRELGYSEELWHCSEGEVCVTEHGEPGNFHVRIPLSPRLGAQALTISRVPPLLLVAALLALLISKG